MSVHEWPSTCEVDEKRVWVRGSSARRLERLAAAMGVTPSEAVSSLIDREARQVFPGPTAPGPAARRFTTVTPDEEPAGSPPRD